jgi:hypothetical protein
MLNKDPPYLLPAHFWTMSAGDVNDRQKIRKLSSEIGKMARVNRPLPLRRGLFLCIPITRALAIAHPCLGLEPVGMS